MSIAALAREIAAHTSDRPGHRPTPTAVPGLTLIRADCPMPPMPLIYKPAICLVAQGAKTGTFGSRRFTYRAGQALVVGVEMPGVGVVSEASAEVPFLGAIVEFDLGAMREVLARLDSLAPSSGRSGGVFVADIEGALADCVCRLVRLSETPSAISIVAPAIARELSYWLLDGPDRAATSPRSSSAPIDRPACVAAIHELRSNDSPNTIARRRTRRDAPVSVRSAFHRVFKAMTSL